VILQLFEVKSGLDARNAARSALVSTLALFCRDTFGVGRA